MIKEIKINDIYDDNNYHNNHYEPSPPIAHIKKSKGKSVKLEGGKAYTKDELYEMAKTIKRNLGGGNIKLSNLRKEELLVFVRKYQL
jgi:hypothetical protein